MALESINAAYQHLISMQEESIDRVEKLDKLDNKSRKWGAEARMEYQNTRKDLRRKLAEAQKKLQAAKGLKEQEWDDYKKSMEKVLSDLKQTLDIAETKFKKSENLKNRFI